MQEKIIIIETENPGNTQNCSKCMLRLGVLRDVCVVMCVGFCKGHFLKVPLNLTHLHCLQHSLIEHLLNLYCNLLFDQGITAHNIGVYVKKRW